ncbi:hypothetical protein SEVIR_9G225755v4 [Setaria viridis]
MKHFHAYPLLLCYCLPVVLPKSELCYCPIENGGRYSYRTMFAVLLSEAENFSDHDHANTESARLENKNANI